jgi:hypothetical protein
VDWSGPHKTSTEAQNIYGTGVSDYVDEDGNKAVNPYKIRKLKEKYLTFCKCEVKEFVAPTTCAAEDCTGPYNATAHVMINDGKKGGGTNKWWLVPTCTHHNLHVKTFEARAGVVFVAVSAVRKM